MTEPEILTPDVAEYLQKHNIEEALTKGVNEILRNMPPDPFADLRSIMKEYTLPSFTLLSIVIKTKIIDDFKEVPCLVLRLSFKGDEREIYHYPIPFTSYLYDTLLKDAGFDQVYTTFDNVFKPHLLNYTIHSYEDFDALLLDSAKEGNANLNQALSNAVSFSTFIAMSEMKALTLPAFIKESYPEFISSEHTIPNLGFSLFKTGKSMNSKVKFERFILFISNQNKYDEQALYDLTQKIYASIRKVLTAGKAGENGLRLNNEGSYFPPTDNMNDILKLLEGIIAEVNDPEALFLGIDCNANNYYNEDTKTYDMDGFKKPPDADGIIEFYTKLVTEHPLILYLEEPMAAEDAEGWEKLLEKFSEDKPNITITSKSKEGRNLHKQEVEYRLKTEPTKKGKDQKKGDGKVLETLSNKEERPAKTEETGKEEEEEEGEEEGSNLAFRIGEVSTLSDLVKTIHTAKGEGEVSIALWDNGYETKQTAVIDFGVGMRVDNIILNGFSMREEKLCKIAKYIQIVKELY